jgi:hypothetical protein
VPKRDPVDGHLTTEVANDRFWSTVSAGRRFVAVDRFEPIVLKKSDRSVMPAEIQNSVLEFSARSPLAGPSPTKSGRFSAKTSG